MPPGKPFLMLRIAPYGPTNPKPGNESMRGEVIKIAALFFWLWLPSLLVLRTSHVNGYGEALAIIGYSIFILVCPLLLIHRLKHFFMFWLIPASFILPYSYMIEFYGSVPSDALWLSSINTNRIQIFEVLGIFGWKLFLIPIAIIIYFCTAYSLNTEYGLSTQARKKLFLGLLLYAMLSLNARQFFALSFKVPPLFEESTANLCFPSNLVLTVARVTRHEGAESIASLQGRPALSLPNNQAMLVVLIVGESLRSDHLTINGYARNTTPKLASLGGEVITFSDVSSTANWTNEGVPGIVSRTTDATTRTPLVQTFKEAGFRTAWLSNQEKNTLSRMADVSDHALSSADFQLRKDTSLLPLFSSFVSQAGNRQFIVLHINGSHIPYEERYEADSLVFKPTLSDIGISEPRPEHKSATINSYDNTVIATDKFVHRVIEILRVQTRPAVLMFTSDHAENLFDDERGIWMHAQTPPTRFDTHVPLLVWMNSTYRDIYPDRFLTLAKNSNRKLSNTNVFPTILELGGVEWNNQRLTESFASNKFTEAKRSVLSAGRLLDYESLK